ncbi:MAG: hypothetical protein FJ264_15425 [Planctomycetes bacterium]|nr:hypothetical protein [Planctomycetota bacterium]
MTLHDTNADSPLFLLYNCQRKVLPLSAISFAGIALVIAGVYFAYREARLTDRKKYHKISAPLLLLGILFIVIISGWR